MPKELAQPTLRSLNLPPDPMADAFVSLMYHNVVRDDAAGARAATAGLSPSITGYFIGEQQFADQLDAIRRVADVLTYADVQRFFAPGGQSTPAPRPRVQLTCDDGWSGSVDLAGPLLAQRGMQMLLFVTTGLIGAPRFVTATQLAGLPRDTFHVGSHTVTHPFLNELADADIADELTRSKKTLEDLVGYAVDAVSIPNGAADARVVRIAHDCGYRFVYLSAVHRNTRRRGPLAIGRVAIRTGTSAHTVARYASGDLRREQGRAAALALPKRLLGPARYRRIRERLIGQRAVEQEMSDLVQLSRHREAPAELQARGDSRNRPTRQEPRPPASHEPVVSQ